MPEVRTIKSPPLYRDIRVGNFDVDERTVELAFSSEEPVERFFGNEILDHDPQSVRLGRLEDAGPVLVDHDPRDHVGVVERVTIDPDKVGRALVRFGQSQRAQEIFQDVQDGIRKSISVGYRIHKAIAEIDGDGDTETVRVTDWEPLEMSFVAIPADVTVKVGRSAETENEFQIETPTIERAEPMPDEKQPDVDLEAVRSEARNKLRDEMRTEADKILKLGERYEMVTEAREHIASGKSFEDFRDFSMEQLNARHTQAAPKTELGMDDQEIRDYSIMKAVRAAVTGDWKDAGLERETSIEIADKLGKEARGFYVPYDVQARTMTAGTDTAGGYLVGTDHLAGSFIDRLRAQSIIGRMGATMLPGLVGDVDIPKLTGGATFYWIAEDADVTDSDGTLGSVVLNPKTVAGSVPMSRRLLKQSAPSVEAMMMNDLVIGASLAIDIAAMEGDGVNKPTGIVNVSGVNTQTVSSAGAPTWAELVGFETEVNSDNALVGSLGYATTPAVSGTLKTTAKDSGSGLFLMDQDRANGYQVVTSSQLTANRIIFGNFSDVIVGMWGVLDIAPDAAAKAASGGLVLRVFQDVDVAVRHAESFCINA
jgi:HK97 family phage major capsid protein